MGIFYLETKLSALQTKTVSKIFDYHLVTETERQAQHRGKLEKVRAVLEVEPGASLRAISEATEIPFKSVQRLRKELEE